MKHRQRRLGRRVAVALAASLGLTLAGPVSTAHAAGSLDPSQCRTIEPYRVLLSEITDRTSVQQVLGVIEQWRRENVPVDVDDIVAYLVPALGDEVNEGATLVLGTANSVLLLCPVVDPLDATHVDMEVVGLAVERPLPPDELYVNPSLHDQTPNVQNDDPEPEDERDGRKGRWRRNGDDCFWMKTNLWERHVCWYLDQQLENDPDRKYFQFRQSAFGYGLGVKIERMWIEANPYDHAVPMDFDGQPEPASDRTASEGCSEAGEEFTIGSGAPVEFGFTWTSSRITCENYKVKGYGEGGHWASIWEGNPHTEGTRMVKLNMPIKVSQYDDRRAEWLVWSGQRRAD